MERKKDEEKIGDQQLSYEKTVKNSKPIEEKIPWKLMRELRRR